MAKDLTTSEIDRQNILNNPYALAEIEKAAGIRGISFEGKTVVLKDQVARFFEVTVRTVENHLENHEAELARNGYEVIKGKRLKALKLAIQGANVPEADFGNIKMTPQLGVFDFRAFLNMAMLMRMPCKLTNKMEMDLSLERRHKFPSIPLINNYLRKLRIRPVSVALKARSRRSISFFPTNSLASVTGLIERATSIPAEPLGFLGNLTLNSGGFFYARMTPGTEGWRV